MKSVINLTPSAEQHINDILSEAHQTVFVIGLDNKGCSGHSYVYELRNNDQLSKFDETIEITNGTIAIKADSVMKLLGSTLGLESDLFGKKFVWTNPHVSNTCGCGKSVSF